MPTFKGMWIGKGVELGYLHYYHVIYLMLYMVNVYNPNYSMLVYECVDKCTEDYLNGCWPAAPFNKVNHLQYVYSNDSA